MHFHEHGLRNALRQAGSGSSNREFGCANLACKITYIASRGTSSSDRHEQIAAEIGIAFLYVIGVSRI